MVPELTLLQVGRKSATRVSDARRYPELWFAAAEYSGNGNVNCRQWAEKEVESGGLGVGSR